VAAALQREKKVQEAEDIGADVERAKSRNVANQLKLGEKEWAGSDRYPASNWGKAVESKDWSDGLRSASDGDPKGNGGSKTLGAGSKIRCGGGIRIVVNIEEP